MEAGAVQLVDHPQFASIQARTYEGSIEEHIATVVAQVGSDPLLTFLDPFGTALPWSQLKDSLLNRPNSAPNEVLLNMNVDALRRIGALPRAEEKHRATVERLDALLGHTGWRETFDAIYRQGQDGSATRAALAVAEEFRRRVREQTGYDSLAVPVRRDSGQEPVFLMTLFFTHPLALYKFSEAVSLANQKWRLEVAQKEAADYLRSAGNMLWEEDLSPDAVEKKVKDDEKKRDGQWCAAIASMLRGLLSQSSHIAIAANLSAVYGDAFGLAREKHLRSALKILEAEGLTRPVTGDLSKTTIQRLS